MVLVFIVTLSLVAAVGMRSVITGERVVANERDRALAFQGAESAGREAVASITAGTHTLNSMTPLTLGGNAEFWRTTSNNLTLATDCTPATLSDTSKRFNWTLTGPGCSTESTTEFGNKDKPHYFIELMPGVLLTGGTQSDCWYRITTRATGGSREADVILQLMFSIKINGTPAACA
jgi:Tfp pilus assembly protein PilX